MAKWNINLNFRVKKIDETRNYLLKEIKHDDLMNEKHEVFRTLNDCEHFLVFVSVVIGCVLISAYTSLVGVPVDTASSAVGLIICAITAGIKTYRSIIKKKRKKHDHTVLLAKN